MSIGPILACSLLVQFRAEVCDRESVRVIRLAGRLEQQQLPELMGLCNGAPKTLRLDLGDLLSADAAGFQTIGMLRRRGTEVVCASPYVTMQLEFEQANHARGLRTGVGPSGSPTLIRADTTTDTEER